MLKSIHIKNFRGFKELNLSPLKRVNLIVGQNNTGKTGLLEALTLMLWESPAHCGNLPNIFRSSGGDWAENFWKWLCYNKDTNIPVEIKANFDGGLEFGILLRNSMPSPQELSKFRPGALSQYGEVGGLKVFTITGKQSAGIKIHVFSTQPTNPRQDAIDYNRVVLRRKKKDVEELLRKIEPKLEALESLQTGQEPLLYADLGLNELIPVTQMGQGFNRLLDIYSELVVADAKVLLIDEVENGLHHSVLSTIWRGLYNAARDADVQIFATTHSAECIQAAHEVFASADDYDFSVVQLFRLPDGVQARVLDRKLIETGVEADIDLR